MKLSEQLKVDGAHWFAAGENKMAIRVITYSAKAEGLERAHAEMVAALNDAYDYIETEPIHDEERCPLGRIRAALNRARDARNVAESSQ